MKALYITDEIDTCDCCGRTDLKATVAMQLSDGGILHYGRTCAARNSGKDQRQIKKEMNDSLNERIGTVHNRARETAAWRRMKRQRMIICAGPKLSPREYIEAMQPFQEAVWAEEIRLAKELHVPLNYITCYHN